MKNKVIFIVLIYIFLLSCSHHERYPESWNSLNVNEPNNCPDITGEYYNEGESGDSTYKPELAWYLFGESAPYEGASYISILQTDEENIVITILHKDESIYKKSLSLGAGDFNCQDGFLKIKNKDFTNRDAVVAIEWNTIGLTKSGRDLVIKNEHGGVGIMCLLPAAGTGTNWYKFKASKY